MEIRNNQQKRLDMTKPLFIPGLIITEGLLFLNEMFSFSALYQLDQS